MDYQVDNAVGEIARSDTKLTIKVDADLEEEFSNQGPVLQAQFSERANTYDFPDGIAFDAAGESDENAELI